MECNAGSAVQITHHFLAQMVRCWNTFCFSYAIFGCVLLMAAKLAGQPHRGGRPCRLRPILHDLLAESQGAEGLLRVHLVSGSGHRVALHGALRLMSGHRPCLVSTAPA